MSLNKIAAQAAQISRVNKKDAFDIIKSIAATSGIIEEYDLARLYKFFQPGVSATAAKKGAFEWVAQAAGVKELRHYLNFLYARDGVLYGSDGHRVHWIETELVEGFYDNAGVAITLDYRYPDMLRVIPPRTTWVPAEWDIRGEIENAGSEWPLYTSPGADSMGRPIGFNTRYVDEAMAGMKNTQVFYAADYYSCAPEYQLKGRVCMRALTLEGEHIATGEKLNALIMPCRG